MPSAENLTPLDVIVKLCMYTFTVFKEHSLWDADGETEGINEVPKVTHIETYLLIPIQL